MLNQEQQNHIRKVWGGRPKSRKSLRDIQDETGWDLIICEKVLDWFLGIGKYKNNVS